MTDFILVRHGETVWHAENRYAGRTDVPLTDLGREQAAALAGWAATAALTGIWSSPLSRARLTAAPAAAACGLTAGVDERLYELDFGQGEGLTRDEMHRRFPEQLAAFLADPVEHHLPDGEHPRHAAERAADCLADLARAQPRGRILLVAHSTLVRVLLCHLVGIPLADYRRVFPRLDNGARTEIRLENGQTALLSFNAPTSALTTALH
ncbi:histidine phosphatase family protein [Streptomyces sp. NBC_01619]|uniref:Histidine phosphatase family protein n=1 Tax=Streptomyces pratisoli TaxID=3139917 RepID=A0ACC6QA28_9ACTN|nr:MULTISPECIES: histidine phosphatase family protein [unclassified Streptomyces]MCX4511120.1 histidine phosphatase family protein [Streptomyces sp. NBC_01619]